MKECIKCGIIKEHFKFGFGKNRKLLNVRRECVKKNNKEKAYLIAEANKKLGVVILQQGNKTCSKCGMTKQKINFYVCWQRKDGLDPHCKQCKSARNKVRRNDPSVRKAQNSASNNYRKNNKDKFKSYHEARKLNPEYIAIRRAAYIKYSIKNKDKCREYSRKYSALIRANPTANLILKIKHHNRRCRKKGVEGTFTVNEIDELFIEQIGRCSFCGVRLWNGFHIDHVIPISRPELSPTNYITNIQLLCEHCNCSKRNLTNEEFVEYKNKYRDFDAEMTNKFIQELRNGLD